MGKRNKAAKRTIALLLAVVMITGISLIFLENSAFAEIIVGGGGGVIIVTPTDDHPNGYGEGGYTYEPPSGNKVTDVFNLIGNTKVDSEYSNVALINREEQYKYGAMWAKKKLDLTRPFETEMYLHMGHAKGKTGELGDGMTFTLQNDPKGINALGLNGEGLGVYGSNYYSNKPASWPNIPVVSKSLVIEFDSYINAHNNTGDHFMSDPVKTGYKAHNAVIATKNPNEAASPGNIRVEVSDHQYLSYFNAGQEWVRFYVKWTSLISGSTVGGKLEYSFGDIKQNIPLSNVINSFGGTEVYWGFSGSTGLYTSLQAAAFVSLPEQEVAVTQTVRNFRGEIIDKGTTWTGETLTYTIQAKLLKAVSGVGPITIKDALPPEVEYAGGQVMMVTSTNAKPVYLNPEAASNITINTNQYLNTEGAWLEIVFNVVVKEGNLDKVIKNMAELSAPNLTETKQSNMTEVTIVERNAGDLTITKVDAEDSTKTLPGAVFEIWDTRETFKTDDDIKVATTQPTGVDGTTTVSSIPFGAYRFVEIKTPTGYLAPPDGEITAAEMTDTSAAKGPADDTFTVNEGEETVTLANINNTIDFTFTKIDGNAFAKEDTVIPLPGAEFTVFRCPRPDQLQLVPGDLIMDVINGTALSACVYWQPVMIDRDGTGEAPYRETSGADGKVTFSLEDGAYMLVEIQAPCVSGRQYVLPSGQWAFKIDRTEQPVISCRAVKDEQGQLPPALTEDNQLLNLRQPDLPVTGNRGTQVFTWAGSLLALGSILLLVLRQKSSHSVPKYGSGRRDSWIDKL